MKSIFINSTYPKNFILLGTQMDELRDKAEVIVSMAHEKFADVFNGEVSSFSFDLRYVAPFEKTFTELMRLQGIAAENIRFKAGYKGYIVIDVGEFLKHEKEPYFQRTIKYLHDENDDWRYIFIVDKTNDKAAKDMTQTILEFIKYTKVIDEENISESNQRFLKETCKERNLKLDADSFRLLENFLTLEKINRNIIETIVCDLSAMYGGTTVTMQNLKDYFENDGAVAKYMISGSTFDKILALCRDVKKKGREHE